METVAFSSLTCRRGRAWARPKSWASVAEPRTKRCFTGMERTLSSISGSMSAAVDAHAEEAHQKAPGIGRDDGHPLALGHAEVVEGRREAPAHVREARVGDAPEPTAGRSGLVDDGDAAAVDQLGALQEIGQREGDNHGERSFRSTTS